jgi:hypothetical protein
MTHPRATRHPDPPTPRARLTADVIRAAHARGYVRLAIAPLARAIGRSESTVREWSIGAPVAPETDRAIRAELGIPSP